MVTVDAMGRASATFRPRPMKGRESWALDADLVSGEGKAIDLNTVTRVHFSDTRLPGGKYSLRMRLLASDNKLTIACMSKPNDDGRAACRRLHAAILRRLHEVNPDASVHIEGGPVKQLLWFGLYLTLTLGSLGLFAATLSDGEMVGVVVGLLAALAFGYFTFHFLPWPSSKFERPPIEAANHVAKASL